MSLRCVGDGLRVPLVNGGEVAYSNLDLAASAPALGSVADAVAEFLPWYSSVHRGAGFASMVATAAYKSARSRVASFVGARDADAVVFTRNTTEATNLLAWALPDDTEVVAFATEHHANLLPWRRRELTVLPPPPTPHAAVEELERSLARRSGRRPRLVAVTGASNVTGELWPLDDIVRVAHRFGARVVVDAAQLAPHRRIDMDAWDVDYLALSGHKLYAPFGSGVLVGRGDWLQNGEPFLAGGGAVDFVTPSEVLWTELPARQEAGSPNVVGAVALGMACRTLTDAGMDRIAVEERVLLDRLLGGLDDIPAVQRYSMWGPGSARIGVVTFNLSGVPPGLLAAVLSAEYGIGVRHGCFCAHPLMVHLLRIDGATVTSIQSQFQNGHRPMLPGAVRASIGLPTQVEHVDRLLAAVREIAEKGHRWEYRAVPGTDDYVPAPDPRPRPAIAAVSPDLVRSGR